MPMVMRIKERREAAGLTQKQLAAAMGVMQSAISSWEKETYLPNVRQLPLLASVLGCTINDLFTPTDSIPQLAAEVHAG